MLDLQADPDGAAGAGCAGDSASQGRCVLPNAGGIGLTGLFHALGHALPAPGTSPSDPQRVAPAEVTELGAMLLELLAMSHLEAGGLYEPGDVARAQRDHLVHGVLTRLTAVAMIDAFEHWAYTHVAEAADPAACGRQWRSLWLRFLPAVDWFGLDGALETEWQRYRTLFLHPFATIACGPAQLGAIQIWAHTRHDPENALSRFRRVLSAGGTRSLPDLFAAAGAHFAFDEHTLREAVDAVEGGLG
jgi:oligoendopeptidase F